MLAILSECVSKTDSNQALLKPIVGIIVGIVKNNNQESPKTLGTQTTVYFLLWSKLTFSDKSPCKIAVYFKSKLLIVTDNKIYLTVKNFTLHHSQTNH